MARFIMVTSTLVEGDAVGNDILQMAQMLRADGHAVGFIAKSNKVPGLEVWPIASALSRLKSDDVLVYHQSVTLPEGVAMFREHRGRRVLRYHNITPPEYFNAYNLDIANGCALGRGETLALLAGGPDAIWAASEYNARELMDSGAQKGICRVVPPLHLIEELHKTKADPVMAAGLNIGQKNILMIGRIVPNKGAHRLIEALGAMKQRGQPMPQLHIAGKITPGLENYANELSARATELGVQTNVKIHQGVSLGELRALLENSQLFAIASEHEGFCVPLVEAMSFGVPILALARAAVPETLGEAGLIWPTSDARVWAASFARILRDGALAQELSTRGRKRYAENFTLEKLAGLLRQAVQQLPVKS